MNEAPNPQPARRADAFRLAGQLSGDPLTPGDARFLCQSVNGLPEHTLQLDGRSVWCAYMPQGRDAGMRQGCRRQVHGVLTSKGRVKNRVFSLEKLRFFDLIISTIRVVVIGLCQVDLNHFLLDLQPVAGGLQNGRFDALGVQWLGGGEPIMLE